MRPLTLRRVVKRRRLVVNALMRTLSESAVLRDAEGIVLVGDEVVKASGAQAYPIEVDGAYVGEIVAVESATVVARAIGELFTAEDEKRAIADETLERYKELSLLHAMSDALSRVLDVNEAAGLVVDQTVRFLRAGSASLWMYERPGASPRLIAASGGAEAESVSPSEQALEQRVLADGQAEMLEMSEGGGGLICAPLRVGQAVFGLLRVRQGQSSWTAGDLKLVTSIASSAAPAISHAVLHRERLRQQVLRQRAERFVSPLFLSAALAERRDVPSRVAVLLCDLGQTYARTEQPQQAGPVESMLAATSIAVDRLMESGATVHHARGETVIGVFVEASIEVSIVRALAAAREVGAAAKEAIGAHPGVAVCAAPSDDTQAFLQRIGLAAVMQSVANGRVLVDEEVASFWPEDARRPLQLEHGLGASFEVLG